MKKNLFKTGLAAGLLAVSTLSMASMVIEGTRVIYKGKEKEAVVRMNNKSTTPLVVQSWIDNGEADFNKKLEEIKVPFTLTPPVARVNVEKGQTLRVSATDVSALPKDRESVFYLNVLEIPPKSAETEGNSIQFTIRSRIKMFYRPAAISGDLPTKVTDSLTVSKAADGLHINNGSPYHITINGGTGNSGTKVGTGMIAPLTAGVIPWDKNAKMGGDSSFKLEYINDYGSATAFEVNVK